MSENTEKLLEIVRTQDSLLEDTGFWDSPSARKKYAFRLSPDQLELSSDEKAELEELNALIYGENGVLKGAVRLFAKTRQQQFASRREFSKIGTTLKIGLPKNERGIQDTYPLDVPAIVRLDLARTNGSASTRFKIMELEGDKTHAFGYSTLIDMMMDPTIPSINRPMGIIESLRRATTNRGIQDSNLALLIGSSESFYEQELEVFAQLARKQGLNIYSIPERDLAVTPKGIPVNGTVTNELVNLPILTPDGRYGTTVDAQSLLDLYAEARVACLIPPKRFLGSKGLIGLISNGDQDPAIEGVLVDTFSQETLDGIRKYLPRTYIINKKNQQVVRDELAKNPNRWVIKKTMSSGMRGVGLPTFADRQRLLLDEACANPFNFVIQEIIDQQTQEFNYAESGNYDILNRAPMFMRIELFASEVGIATVLVTARETPDVHGAKDAIQIPAVFES